MSNKLLFFTSLTLLLGSFSCQSAEQEAPGPAFFSITDYFDGQVEVLNQQKYRLEKKIQLNQQSEQKTIIEPDFKAELAPFVANDINRPAWRDQYSVDSLIQDDRLTVIQYKAIEESLHTREISIHFGENGEVEMISLEAMSHSVLSSAKKSMKYFALSNYLIESTESNKAGDKVKVEITGRFLK